MREWSQLGLRLCLKQISGGCFFHARAAQTIAIFTAQLRSCLVAQLDLCAPATACKVYLASEILSARFAGAWSFQNGQHVGN